MTNEYLIGDFLKRIKRPIQLIDDREYKLVTIKMNHNGVTLREYKKGTLIKSNMYEVKEGDFILSGIDARNGAFGIVPAELDGAIVTNDFWYFELDESIISKKLFLELTATTWFDEICKRGSDGTTQRIRLQKDKFFNQTVLLPHGNEQEALLKKILTFKRFQSDMDYEIINQKKLLTQLKQSILQEAINGKLTDEWRKANPNTEPASELLKHIKIKKEKLIKEKKIKKEKQLSSINEEEIPFELPENWNWCKLGDIIINSDNLNIHNELKSNELINYVDIDAIDNKKQMIRESKLIPVSQLSSRARRVLKKGNILYSLVRPYLHNLAIVEDEKSNHIGSTGFAVFDCLMIENKYIFWLLLSKYIEDTYMGLMDGFNSPSITHEQFRNTVIPIAPLEEQKIIIQRIEALIANCQILDSEITLSEKHSQILMQTVLKEAFEVKNENVSLDSLFENVNYSLYVAMIHKQIENRLRINYGEVATQKTVFNINAFTDQKIPYNFINSNHGTFSPQLKEDLSKNSYLAKDRKGNGEVFIINPLKLKEVLDALSNPKNKSFVRAVNEVLDIYELPFINKETDKIELLNTVAKLIIDSKSKDLETIYTGMLKWEIKQNGFKTKAEKFSKSDTQKMINLIENLGLVHKLKKFV